MQQIIKYLDLRRVGILEILIAMYPILSGYSYGPVRCNVLFVLIMAAIAWFKPVKHSIPDAWLWVMIIFVLFHEMFLGIFIDVKSYMINNTISITVMALCIIPIAKATDYKKLVGSLNWVAIITIIGLVYHFGIITSGGFVTPIKLPFMPDMSSSTRLYEVGYRPVSFFWEPAACVTFLMVPLFISLQNKKFIWTSIIILAMFLSTSSTGILMSMLMVMVYALTQKIKLSTRVLVVLMGASLVYGLLNTSYFEAGVNKIENTDRDNTSRLVNGPRLYNKLNNTELLFGIMAANVDDYIHNDTSDKNYFLPTFWHSLIKYGVFGLVIMIMIYLSLLYLYPPLLPYMCVIFVAMFFQGISYGSNNFVYQLIFLYSYVQHYRVKSNRN